jgi:aspartate aminotransferase
MYFLEGADDEFGIACLGGECFGDAGNGFLRFSCAEPDDRLQQALNFIPEALSRQSRIDHWLETHPEFCLQEHYEEP